MQHKGSALDDRFNERDGQPTVPALALRVLPPRKLLSPRELVCKVSLEKMSMMRFRFLDT